MQLSRSPCHQRVYNARKNFQSSKSNPELQFSFALIDLPDIQSNISQGNQIQYINQNKNRETAFSQKTNQRRTNSIEWKKSARRTGKIKQIRHNFFSRPVFNDVTTKKLTQLANSNLKDSLKVAIEEKPLLKLNNCTLKIDPGIKAPQQLNKFQSQKVSVKTNQTKRLLEINYSTINPELSDFSHKNPQAILYNLPATLTPKIQKNWIQLCNQKLSQHKINELKKQINAIRTKSKSKTHKFIQSVKYIDSSFHSNDDDLDDSILVHQKLDSIANLSIQSQKELKKYKNYKMRKYENC